MMRKALLGLASLLLVAYLALCAGLYLMQGSMLYFPQPAAAATPWLELPGTDAGVRVAVHEQAGAEAVVYLGGNAEDVSTDAAGIAARVPRSRAVPAALPRLRRQCRRPAKPRWPGMRWPCSTWPRRGMRRSS